MLVGDDQKRQVQEATDIVALIGEQVALRPRGHEFLGLCPFHDDHNPSMHVSPAKQIYKCFVCGAGGDAFSFVVNYHKMTFPEALRHLADRAGIKLKPVRGLRSALDEASTTDRDRIAAANDKAMHFFQAALRHPEVGRLARDYLAARHINAEMIAAFALGYAPDAWDKLAQTATSKGWPLPGLEAAGLIARRDTGAGHYDKLRHRLIFPILDSLGRPIAFGGRRIRDEDEPKYLNSPETALFIKSSTLYGLHRAKKPIIDSRTAIIVEGYTDVIACHQMGVTNVVATLGTALTPRHVQELRRFADQVILVFDADEAGQKAADRALEIFLAEDMDVAIAVLGGGKDAGELLGREDGLQQWQAAIQAAQDALTYQFHRVSRQFQGAQTVTGRQRVIETYLRSLAAAGLARQSPLRAAVVRQRIASLLGMSESTASDLLRQTAPPIRPRPAAQDAAVAPPGPLEDAETAARIRRLRIAGLQLIGCLVREPSFFHQSLADGQPFDEAVSALRLVSPGLARLCTWLTDRIRAGARWTLASLLTELQAEGQAELVALVTDAEAQAAARPQGRGERTAAVLRDVVATLAAAHRDRQYQALQQSLATDASDAVLAAAWHDNRTRSGPVPRRMPRPLP